MSDTNDMHRDFEAWELNQRDRTGFWPTCFEAYQAATERATSLERARCAMVCESLKTVCGTDDMERGWNGALRRSAFAIRQGGAT